MPVIWVHCGEVASIASTQSLVRRLADRGDGISLLVTAPPTILDRLDGLPPSALRDQLPVESPTRTRDFLDHHSPKVLIWDGGDLRPTLVRAVVNSDIYAIFMNARMANIIAGAARWIPGAAKTAVQAFDQVLTADGATATRLRRAGLPTEKVRLTGPVLEDPLPLPHDANELTVMAEALEARPVWFAARISAPEVKHMAAAHLAASRKSHRMLLLITPADIDSGPDVAAILREAGLKTGVRSEGDDPTAEMQAYVADLSDELGLWYRLAPLTFIGGTLSGGQVASPFDPIVLGSAVIHGTRKAPHQIRFDRLASVEASREIRSASELGIAVGTLLSPEQTARMALAGWEEITRTADITNEIIDTALTRATGERHPA